MGPGPARAAALTAYAQSLIALKARQLCRKPGFSRSDEEDLVQELTLSLLAKADQYDPDRGASRDTFADRVVMSAVKMILRARRRTKRAAGFHAESLQTDGPICAGMFVPLALLIEGSGYGRRGITEPTDPLVKLELQEAIDVALAALDPETASMARLRSELSVNAMAKQTGLSRRQINAAMDVIRDRFKESGLDPR